MLWKTEATRASPSLELSRNSGHRNGGTKRGDHAGRDTHDGTPSFGGLTAMPIYAHMGRFFKASRPFLLGFSGITVYAAALAIASLVLVITLAVTTGFLSHDRSPWPLLGLAVLAFVAERQSVRLTANLELSVAFLPLLFVAVVFGPLPAALIGAATVLTDFGRPFTRWVIWTANRTIVGGLAGVAAIQAMNGGSNTFGRILAATCVAAIVDFGLDFVLNGTTLVLRGTGSISDLARATGPVALAGIPLYTSLVGVLAYTYIAFTPWSAALFFIPALAAQRLFVMYREQQEALTELGEANDRLERANLSFATALVATLDARDRYTAGHSAAVAIYSRDIAARMGLTDDEQHLVHLCGLVHDIGKVGLPAGLLEKPGALTLDERRLMEDHAAIGERILSKVEDYADVARIVRHHHERVDGLGYPDGIRGDEIPLLARIIAVADAYDAMTSDRPYRDAMPSRVARLRLAQAVESQFDTGVVAAFEAILAGASEAYRVGSRHDFSLETQREHQPALVAATA
jgi:putative nucleotidyltransferase with HDIG domain